MTNIAEVNPAIWMSAVRKNNERMRLNPSLAAIMSTIRV